MLEDYLLLPELYGTSCTINTHSLIHLALFVRYWGPLWTQSAFSFESMNELEWFIPRKICHSLHKGFYINVIEESTSFSKSSLRQILEFLQ